MILMGFKKKDWEYFGQRKGKHNFSNSLGGLSFELFIKDETGTKIDFLRWNTKEGYKRIINLIKEKYGIDYESKPIPIITS